MSLTVHSGDLVVQDPSDARVYVFDWGAENLPALVEISGAATWTLTTLYPVGATALTKDNESVLVGNRQAQVRLQGGQHGAKYNVACRITTNESPAQTKEQSFDVLVENR
jgi:hypothetical protein